MPDLFTRPKILAASLALGTAVLAAFLTNAPQTQAGDEPANETPKTQTATASSNTEGSNAAHAKGKTMSYDKPSDAELRESLTQLQYQVTQQDGTEPPFRNKYWDNKEHGIYVDVVTGEPLFSSLDKYKSGTGWPSFTRPLEPENVVTKKDFKLVVPRTEVRSKHGDSHLGHVFNDGPAPTGQRYCMNSAALRFVPVAELEQQGYGRYVALFEDR